MEKVYAVVRSVLDRKGKQLEKQDISKHEKYHDACDGLREAIYSEASKLFRIGKKDIFDDDGNLKTNSPYIKECINECDPYRWKIGNTKIHTTIVYEVVRRIF